MMKRALMLCCALIAFSFSAVSQTPNSDTPSCREAMQKFAEKYEESERVTSAVLVKGSGLEMMKLMLRKEFEKDVIKGVDMIILVEYADATEDEANAIRGEVEKLAVGLEKVVIPEGEKPKAKRLGTYYKLSADKKSISDMLILIEEENERCVMYLGGVIRDESIVKK
ncbi:MAG: DUF4252 domain-containing protein [Alistipes sp.]|nr:DUF4252 domain-containing protein [Alistipes sp.]